MATKNRLNPNPESRATLKQLEQRGILRREKVGIRNIIRAATDTVEQVGFDLSELHGDYWRDPTLPNFCPGAVIVSAWVGYNNGRASIAATQGREGWQGHVLDVSTHFPENRLATALLRQDCTKGSYFNKKLPMHGDAVLVTDVRAHWIFQPSCRIATAEDLEVFDGMLVSPRDLIASRWSGPCIFFHAEPCWQDLIALKLRWM